MNNQIIETRGAPRKYNFEQLKLNEQYNYGDVDTNAVGVCLRYYIKHNKLDWKFRAFNIAGETIVVRTK